MSPIRIEEIGFNPSAGGGHYLAHYKGSYFARIDRVTGDITCIDAYTFTAVSRQWADFMSHIVDKLTFGPPPHDTAPDATYYAALTE